MAMISAFIFKCCTRFGVGCASRGRMGVRCGDAATSGARREPSRWSACRLVLGRCDSQWLRFNKALCGAQASSSGLFARVVALKFHGPRGAIVVRFFPGLLHVVVVEVHDFDAVENCFAVRAAAGAGEFGGALGYFSFKDVHAALIVCEHAVPALVVRAVGEHVFARVAFAADPALDDEAFIEREVDFAAGGGGHSRIADGPIAEPEVELAAFCVCGAAAGILRTGGTRSSETEARDCEKDRKQAARM